MIPLKLSVALITYNHGKFIRETLESIFSQVTDFEFEVIIGDDCSTDNTPEILREYADKYKNIKLILRDHNIGVHKNESDVFSKCSGEYIALLEGDDYWSDVCKLQKQVELLEDDDTTYLTYSNFSFINELGLKTGEYTSPLLKADYLDILGGFCPKTATVVFRKEKMQMPLPAEYFDVSYTDHFLFAIITRGGFAVSNQQNNSCHRLHSGGTFGRISPAVKYQNMINNFNIFKHYFCSSKELKKINKSISRVYSLYISHLFFTFKFLEMVTLLKKMIIFDIENMQCSSVKSIYKIPSELVKRIFNKILKII